MNPFCGSSNERSNQILIKFISWCIILVIRQHVSTSKKLASFLMWALLPYITWSTFWWQLEILSQHLKSEILKGTYSYIQTKRLLEQSPFDRWDLSWDCWSYCIALPLGKTNRSISAQTPHTNCQWMGDKSDLFCCHRPGHLAVSESNMNFSVLKFDSSRVKSEAICLTAKAWLKLGHATG